MTEIEEILDPECNSERWWKLAKDYPLDAMASALYFLLTLESPERWEQLQKENIGDWVKLAVERLPFRERELFAADCAERVLHLYERECPGDTRVREVIEARRRYALGLISQEEWEAAREVTVAAARSTYAYVAYAAAAAARSADAAAAYASARYAERVWQWGRAQQYLRGEAK